MASKHLFEIPIVFCADGRFISHAMTTMLSVLTSNPDFNFKFFLLGSELDGNQEKQILEKVESFGSSFEYLKIDDAAFEGFPVPHHFSKANYYRLLIAELIPFDRAIYLDADIIVVNSLRDFLEINLAENMLAAVADPIYKWKLELGMKQSSTYFNSGVMLMNLDLWKLQKITEKAFDFINEYSQKIRFVDQCALNAVIDGDFVELNPKFNQQAILYRENFDFGSVNWTPGQIEEALKSPILIHYTGPSKPWEYNSNHPRKSEYWKVQKDSPFKLDYPEGMVWSDHLKKLFPNSLKKKIRALLNLS